MGSDRQVLLYIKAWVVAGKYGKLYEKLVVHRGMGSGGETGEAAGYKCYSLKDGK